jgi:hypothetical protein
MSVLEIPDEAVIQKLCGHKFGVLATYGGEYPYTSLISLVVAADGRSLFFPTDRQTRKYANLQHEARVSVLLDNRGEVEKTEQSVYALTMLGSAYEVAEDSRPAMQASYLKHHPHLTDFLAQPQTALVQVIIAKIILVEKFQDVREFEWPSGHE